MVLWRFIIALTRLFVVFVNYFGCFALIVLRFGFSCDSCRIVNVYEWTCLVLFTLGCYVYVGLFPVSC